MPHVHSHALIDDVLAQHAAALAHDFVPYRNHVYRVINVSRALAGEAALDDKLALSAAFHDLGIWTHGTFDYIPPSIALAREHLSRTGHDAWAPEVSAAIALHHKLRAARNEPALVELLRRADWVDVSLGVRSFGVRRALVRELYAQFPDAGFHARLAKLALRRAVEHPLSPLPMLRF
jgi:HD domain